MKKDRRLLGRGESVAQNPANISKIHSILSAFASGRSLNRFDAERLHDHCLHSTVSTIQRGFGILIDRRWESVPCLGGRDTVRVKRYNLRPTFENVAAAMAALGRPT